MAKQKQTVLRLTWENKVGFTLSAKYGEEEFIDVISMREDAETATIWGAIQSACVGYVQKLLSNIGQELMQ